MVQFSIPYQSRFICFLLYLLYIAYSPFFFLHEQGFFISFSHSLPSLGTAEEYQKTFVLIAAS